MATIEAGTQSRDIDQGEPGSSQLVRVTKKFAKQIGPELMREVGYRVKLLDNDNDEMVLEPLDGYEKRYPPIEVSGSNPGAMK